MGKYEKLIFYFALVFIIFSIALKIMLVCNLPLGFNEGGYALVSSGLLEGNDVFDHKPPFLHYLLAFFFEVFGKSALTIHSLAFVLDMILAGTIFFVASNYLGKEKATIASALYLALSFIEGIYLDSEIPSAIFGLLGIFIYLKALKGNKINYFISGMFVAISIWFKQPAVLFFIGIIIHQSILRYKKEIDTRKYLNNVLLNLLGILIISLPLLSLFLWKDGFEFIFKIITFNLLFDGSTPRLIAAGKAVYIIIASLGLLFIPLINNKTKHKLEYSALKTLIVIWILFFIVSQEIFYNHLFHVIPFLIIIFLFAVEGYNSGENKIIYALIMLIILIPTLTNANSIARDIRDGGFEKQKEVISYLDTEIPESAKVFSDNPAYQFAIGKQSLYKVPGLAPSFASVFDLSDFCEFSDKLDYLILTHREKYLPEETLNCTLNKFTLVKRFDNVGESFVELWRKTE